MPQQISKVDKQIEVLPLTEYLPNQKSVWRDNLTGSQIHNLFHPSKLNYFQLLLEKKGFKTTASFKGNPATRHGTKCEGEIGIPELEKRFKCKNDIKRAFINPTCKIAGNIDFVNVKEKIVIEIKTTFYDDDKNASEQNETIKHGIFQLLFYQQYLNWAHNTNYEGFLAIIQNLDKCQAIEPCKHEVLVFALSDIKKNNPALYEISMLDIVKDFWLEYEDFDKLYSFQLKRDDETIEMWIDDFSDSTNELRTLELQYKTLKNTILTQSKNYQILTKLEKDITFFKDRIKTWKTNELTFKNKFYYSPFKKTFFYNYTIPIKCERKMIGIKKL